MCKWTKKRKLVYWGAGEIGKKCILKYAHKCPCFMVDSYAKENTILGIRIVNPEQIVDWSEYFVVITVENKSAIKKILESKGLKEKEDYIGYEVFFEIPASDSLGTLEYAREQVICDNIDIGRDIIVIPFYFSSRMDHVRTFFMEYIKKHGEENFIILHGIQYIDDSNIKDDFSCRMIPYRIPEMEHMENDIWRAKLQKLTEEENDIVNDIEHRKKNRNPIELIRLRYAYYKELFDILKPRSVIWWGGWARDTYIVQSIARRQIFDFAVAEHGWIKGTINFDKAGIAGQSQFCLSNDESLKGEDEYNMSLWKKIKRYLLSVENTKVDNKTEWNKIMAIEKNKPTFLLIGMADYGMDMNPDSDYWKQKISPSVKGSLDAVDKCAKICQKNGWNLIYKPHPKESEEQVITEVRMSSVTYVQDISIEKLIDVADVSISITSAVDFSVLLHDKPLIQLGKNSLNVAECTYLVTEINELEIKMLEAIKYGYTDKQRENYERHMMKLLNTVLWDDNTKRTVRYGRNLAEEIFNV